MSSSLRAPPHHGLSPHWPWTQDPVGGRMLGERSLSHEVPSEGTPLAKKGTSRRSSRMNILSILFSLILPWAMFAVVIWVLSFQLHHYHVRSCYMIVFLGFLVVLVCGMLLVKSRQSTVVVERQQASWLGFLCLTLALAWLSGLILGVYNYKAHTQAAYELMELNTYVDVDPTRMRGEQLMDAGAVQFVEGTRVDVAKSMGFKNKVTYCVAPISFGNTTLSSYDFWAVGRNCCDGAQATFHCAGYDRGHGALRLLADAPRAYYRLAVQQAEAMYGIKAVHPLFFTWVEDVVAEEQSWRDSGRTFFLLSISVAFALQAFTVVVVAFAFAKFQRP